MEKTRVRTRKLDGVIEAAHFNADGSLAWVRAYERRGPTWSDVVLLDRPTLIQRLKAGKRFYVGTRKEFWASEFELSGPLRLVKGRRGPILVVGQGAAQQDRLDELPLV